MHDISYYKEMLSKEDLSAEDRIQVLDAITEDLTEAENKEKEVKEKAEEINKLRDTNQRLFLRVTEPVSAPQITPKKDADETFKEMIANGIL